MPDIIAFLSILSVFTLILSLLLFQGLTGVPPMPARASEVADVIALFRPSGLTEQAIIYELGCGWGTLVIALAGAFPHARIRGIELSPLPYWVARFRTRHMPNVSLHRGNFHHADLRDAQAVACYLMMKPMPKLAALLDTMLKPGTPVVSLTFWFRGREPAAVRKGPGLRGEAALYYWPARDINISADGQSRP